VSSPKFATPVADTMASSSVKRAASTDPACHNAAVATTHTADLADGARADRPSWPTHSAATQSVGPSVLRVGGEIGSDSPWTWPCCGADNVCMACRRVTAFRDPDRGGDRDDRSEHHRHRVGNSRCVARCGPDSRRDGPYGGVSAMRTGTT
jgi:hypothetical protein